MKNIAVVAFIAIHIAASAVAMGQAFPANSHKGPLQVGGYFVADFPDYTNSKFYGYGAYVDLDFREHLGAEFDYRQASDYTTILNNHGQPDTGGPHVPSYERSYEIAGRYFRNYGRVNPYVKVGIGRGSFEYPPLGIPNDQTISQGTLSYFMVTGGTGLDYTLTHHLSVRADFEYQRWFSGTTSAAASPNNINGLPRGLTPILYSGGVAYRFGYGNIMP